MVSVQILLCRRERLSQTLSHAVYVGTDALAGWGARASAPRTRASSARAPGLTEPPRGITRPGRPPAPAPQAAPALAPRAAPALGHWLEEDLSAKEIDELNLIKDMVTSKEPGILRAHPDRLGRRGGAVVAGAARQRRGGISLMMCAPCPLTASSVRCCRPCTAHSYHPSAAYCSHLVDTPSGATVHEWD